MPAYVAGRLPSTFWSGWDALTNSWLTRVNNLRSLVDMQTAIDIQHDAGDVARLIGHKV